MGTHTGSKKFFVVSSDKARTCARFLLKFDGSQTTGKEACAMFERRSCHVKLEGCEENWFQQMAAQEIYKKIKKQKKPCRNLRRVMKAGRIFLETSKHFRGH